MARTWRERQRAAKPPMPRVRKQKCSNKYLLYLRTPPWLCQFPRKYVRTLVQTTIFLANKTRLNKLRLLFFAKNLAHFENLLYLCSRKGE